MTKSKRDSGDGGPTFRDRGTCAFSRLAWGFALLLVWGCGSTTSQVTADAGSGDQQGSEVTSTMDAGDAAIADAAPVDEGTPGDAATGDGATVVCAPLPSGGPKPAGTAAIQATGPVVPSTATRPELSAALADGEYTIRKVLAQGGTLTVSAGGSVPGTGTVSYSLTDNWDPVANGIGDPATFTPMFTIATDGSGTHTSINAAFQEAILLAPCSRVYIRILPGVYREQIIVASKTSAPPLTLYSTDSDASKTRIVFDGAAATKGSMTLSATMTVKAVWGFQMKNLTVANDYVEGSAAGDDQSGVALLNQADRAQFENVRIVGNIAPLYLKSVDVLTAARSYFRDSYVEGDQDIILGRGTAVFDHTEIKYLTGRQATGGVIAYPSTVVQNRYGFLFESCAFTAEAGASGIFLGRQWMESGNVAAIGKVIVRNSTLGNHIAAAPWSTVGGRMTTPKNAAGTTPMLVFTSDDYFPSGSGPAPAEPYLGEYGNTGPGAHQ